MEEKVIKDPQIVNIFPCHKLSDLVSLPRLNIHGPPRKCPSEMPTCSRKSPSEMTPDLTISSLDMTPSLRKPPSDITPGPRKPPSETTQGLMKPSVDMNPACRIKFKN